jgi:hypothetical protein
VGAGVAHRERFSFGGAPEHERHFQQKGLGELLPANLRAPRRRIPKIPQETGIRFALRFRDCYARCLGAPLHQCSYRFAHCGRIVVYRLMPEQRQASSRSSRLMSYQSYVQRAQHSVDSTYFTCSRRSSLHARQESWKRVHDTRPPPEVIMTGQGSGGLRT